MKRVQIVDDAIEETHFLSIAYRRYEWTIVSPLAAKMASYTNL